MRLIRFGRLGVGLLIAVAAVLWASASALATQTPTTLEAEPQLVTFPSTSGVGVDRVSATLKSGGTGLGGEKINFTAVGASGITELCSPEPKTEPNGTASCTLSPTLEDAVLFQNKYTAEFAGDSTYLGSTSTTVAIELGPGPKIEPPPPLPPPPGHKPHH
jgi:hypothetical protein